MFTLHPQLAADTIILGQLPLSLLLLHKDSQYPWCILVPQRENIREIFQLDDLDRQQLMSESCQLAEVMNQVFCPHKLNIAALGNLVPQLHLHHVARFEHDPTWPQPIWGRLPPVEYTENALETRIQILLDALTKRRLII
jgi:diadenosine tetraphosphate (Ap4A) HIT family hydrolase